LIERELISKREEGRSPILTTTKKFQEYFRLSKDGKNFRQEFSTDSKVTKNSPDSEILGADESVIDGNGAAFEENISVSSESIVATEKSNAISEEHKSAEFDASPDPDGPSIGEPGQIETLQVETISSNSSVNTVTASEGDVESDTFVDSSSSASETTSLQ
jgi:hypothetical protein